LQFFGKLTLIVNRAARRQAVHPRFSAAIAMLSAGSTQPPQAFDIDIDDPSLSLPNAPTCWQFTLPAQSAKKRLWEHEK
jgi:hypothetical protein